MESLRGRMTSDDALQGRVFRIGRRCGHDLACSASALSICTNRSCGARGRPLPLPGRILGYFWKDLLRGLRLLNAHEFEASKICSQRFLTELSLRPWLKNLVWLGGSAYPRDPEVLALNNLGAAELGLGEFEMARRSLDRAIEVDDLCPLPYYNIGVLLRASGMPEEAEQQFEQAARLGFKRSISDKIIIASQTRFANTDGRG